jgi:hypothetical protein
MLVSQSSKDKLVSQTQSHLSALKAFTTDVTLDLKQKTVVYVKESAASNLVRGLEITESEIANHYLDGQKYGLAGSTGSALVVRIIFALLKTNTSFSRSVVPIQEILTIEEIVSYRFGVKVLYLFSCSLSCRTIVLVPSSNSSLLSLS